MSAACVWRDAMGRAVRIPEEGQRLVALVPSLTEVLFDYGFGTEVVGITDYCTEPASAVRDKPRIGGTKNPDLEAILALRPTLIFAVAEENRRQDIVLLEQAGAAVYVFNPVTVRDGIDLLWRMAEILDCQARVEDQLHAIEGSYVETQARVSGCKPVRVFCPIWKAPYMTMNAGTYIHDMLRVCGGANIFAERQRRYPLAADLGKQPERMKAQDADRDRRYPRVTLEEMAVLRPDVILLPDEPYEFGPDDLADFAPFKDVPAVRHGRVHLIDGKLLSWYGLRLGSSLSAVRHLLWPH